MSRFSSRDTARISSAVNNSELRRNDYTASGSYGHSNRSARMVTFANISGETFPAFCVGAKSNESFIPMDIYSDSLKEPFFTIQKTDLRSFSINYIVNDSIPVDSCSYGQGIAAGWCKVRYELLCGKHPNPGDELGPVPDQWYLKAGYPGIFTVYGIIDKENKIAVGWLHQVKTIRCRLYGNEGDPTAGMQSNILIPNSDCKKSCTRAWGVMCVDPHNVSGGIVENYLCDVLAKPSHQIYADTPLASDINWEVITASKDGECGKCDASIPTLPSQPPPQGGCGKSGPSSLVIRIDGFFGEESNDCSSDDCDYLNGDYVIDQNADYMYSSTFDNWCGKKNLIRLYISPGYMSCAIQRYDYPYNQIAKFAGYMRCKAGPYDCNNLSGTVLRINSLSGVNFLGNRYCEAKNATVTIIDG